MTCRSSVAHTLQVTRSQKCYYNFECLSQVICQLFLSLVEYPRFHLCVIASNGHLIGSSFASITESMCYWAELSLSLPNVNKVFRRVPLFRVVIDQNRPARATFIVSFACLPLCVVWGKLRQGQRCRVPGPRSGSRNLTQTFRGFSAASRLARDTLTVCAIKWTFLSN